MNILIYEFCSNTFSFFIGFNYYRYVFYLFICPVILFSSGHQNNNHHHHHHWEGDRFFERKIWAKELKQIGGNYKTFSSV